MHSQQSNNDKKYSTLPLSFTLSYRVVFCSHSLVSQQVEKGTLANIGKSKNPHLEIGTNTTKARRGNNFGGRLLAATLVGTGGGDESSHVEF
jgi:hypothetical protein